jgi:nucleotide-binding universal stress UspA family protein
MSRIICAIDLTDSAAPIIATAASLARALHVPLELLHVVHMPPGLPVEYLQESVVVDVRAKAVAALEVRVAELRASGLDASAHVALGLVDDGILERAANAGAELLVIGTHARRRAARFFVGSIAERTVRGANCPVVVVPPATQGRLAQAGAIAGPVRIVAGIDASPASAAVLAWLRTVDRRTRCDLRLVHLYWPPREHERLGLGTPDPTRPDPEIASVLTRELGTQIAAHLGREDVPLQVRASWGAEETPLASEADTGDADLLVVGTNQRRGSTAIATLRGAHLPVVCVPSRPTEAPDLRLAPVRTVVVTTDFSPLGNAAIPEACRLLLRGGGMVVLLHVAETEEGELSPQRRNELQEALLALLPHGMSAQGVAACPTVATDGPPARSILEAIRRFDPDLVVMSSHGRSGVARAVRGSVTEQVMKASPRPVVVVPPGSLGPYERREDEI